MQSEQDKIGVAMINVREAMPTLNEREVRLSVRQPFAAGIAKLTLSLKFS